MTNDSHLYLTRRKRKSVTKTKLFEEKCYLGKYCDEVS